MSLENQRKVKKSQIWLGSKSQEAYKEVGLGSSNRIMVVFKVGWKISRKILNHKQKLHITKAVNLELQLGNMASNKCTLNKLTHWLFRIR